MSNKAEQLLIQIDKKALAVYTDSLDISFGEISSMYEDGELEIRPAYQRLFRWNTTQQSQLIETLLLGLPIPPIFVTETESRRYELIDGLQRISTYLRFDGRLKGNTKLVLSNCDIVPELNGMTKDELSGALTIKLKRSYVKMYIIKKDNPPRIKYDMFKRLNTGGSLLEAQEIRNSTIRFLDEEFINFIQKLSGTDDFRNCISYVQDYLLERQFDDELVLRFFTLKNGDLGKYQTSGLESLADFMTKYAEDVASNAKSFDYATEEDIFTKTFRILNKTSGKDAFSNTANQLGQFHAFYYEAISLAIASIIDKINPDDDYVCAKLRENIERLKSDKGFQQATENKGDKKTSGSSYVEFFHRRVDIAKECIKQDF